MSDSAIATRNCPLCNSQDYRYVGNKPAFNRDHHYSQCNDCSLIFANQLPSMEQMDEAYAGGFTVRSIGRKTTKLAPLIGYFKLKRLFSSNKEPITFLDIGSNAGYFTEAARRLGCDASGIELNSEAVALAQDKYPLNNYYCETIEQFSERGKKFDIIYCSEVIEHALDFHSFVKAIKDCSHDNTLLFLTTPDAAHFKVPKDLISWKEIIPVEHLHLFDKKNLRKLLQQYGYDIKFSYPMLRANQRHFCKPIKNA